MDTIEPKVREGEEISLLKPSTQLQGEASSHHDLAYT